MRCFLLRRHVLVVRAVGRCLRLVAALMKWREACLGLCLLLLFCGCCCGELGALLREESGGGVQLRHENAKCFDLTRVRGECQGKTTSQELKLKHRQNKELRGRRSTVSLLQNWRGWERLSEELLKGKGKTNQIGNQRRGSPILMRISGLSYLATMSCTALSMF